ncbi:hypothetical protein [Halomonas salinarum]|uniref:hypothetical protein n=1 Tax=Halomonas salinarum TaxID=1158993 RepID=UPI001438E12A|nr:hypothetical protein [Halomonas salinarum]
MNEPQRLQYLEAMGLTAWVGRYRLPNAAATEVCAWEEPAAPAAKAPAARLQALMEDVAESRPSPSTGVNGRQDARPADSGASQDAADRGADRGPARGADRQADKPSGKGVGRVRALLRGEDPEAQASSAQERSPHEAQGQNAKPQEGKSHERTFQDAKPHEGQTQERLPQEPQADASATATKAIYGEGHASPPGEALRFSLQVAALEGRWLLVLPSASPPGEMPRRLLANLLRAAGIRPAEMPAFQHFRWPMMDELPVSAPLEEARDGLRAFIDGRRRQGWQPERLLVFGEDTTLSRVLAIEDGICPLLDIPAWQGPSLEVLAADAAAKRDLWPSLRHWGEAWQSGALKDGARDDVPGDDGVSVP